MKLDAGTRERLVYLRLLHRHAQQRALDRTHVGRHEAVILLDGACEHAMLLALGHFGESPTKNFHGHYSKLKERFGANWAPDGWGGVQRLHGMRNETQHRGTVPDAAEFGRWAADVERFINSVIADVFEVDLQSVATAQAVENAEIRAILERAEAALDDDEFKESFLASFEALKAAREKWGSERTDALGPAKHRPMFHEDLTAEYVKAAVDRMEEFVAIEPFAPDVGEYIWLKSTARALQQEAPATQEDAERALVFVMSWVLRWEAFSHRYTRDRARAHRQELRPATTSDPDAVPHIGSVEVEGPDRPPQEPELLAFNVRLTVVDIPDAETGLWMGLLNKRVREQWVASELSKQEEQKPYVHPRRPMCGVSLSPNGGIVFRGICDEAETERCVEFAEVTIAAAHETWRESREAMAESSLDADALQQQYASAVADLQLDGQPLVTSTEVAVDWVGTGKETRQVATVTLTLRVGDDSHLRQLYWKALSDAGELSIGGGGKLDLDRERLHAPGSMSPDELAGTLARAARAVEEKLEAERAVEADADAKRRAIEDVARARLT